MPNPTGHWRFRPMYMQMRTGFAGGGERKLNEQPGMAGAPMPLQANVRKSSPSLLSVAPPPRQRKHFPEAWIWVDLDAAANGTTPSGDVRDGTVRRRSRPPGAAAASRSTGAASAQTLSGHVDMGGSGRGGHAQQQVTGSSSRTTVARARYRITGVHYCIAS
ncbi:hypothetical protein niasHT_010727 [Heterodera trifolii]|uniref:Uncharacterized protein n=1 Tax=Heterodera trifolii TaxID=157864 RepID=A0ABD2LJQ0_9BILA